MPRNTRLLQMTAGLGGRNARPFDKIIIGSQALATVPWRCLCPRLVPRIEGRTGGQQGNQEPTISRFEGWHAACGGTSRAGRRVHMHSLSECSSNGRFPEGRAHVLARPGSPEVSR